MITRLRVGLLASLLLGSAAPALAQPASSPPTQTPTFRAGTSAVVLDVVVRDRKGRAVTDLRQDEIEILEDGKPVAVQTFGLVRGASSTVTAREAETGNPIRCGESR